jgi:hypothetical protein
LLLAARGSVRQAVAVLAHVARPAALCWMRCSITLRRYAGFRHVQSQIQREEQTYEQSARHA